MACPLEAELAAWDGKDTGVLEALFRKKQRDREFLQSLITACNTQGLQRGATWLLKHHLERADAPLSAALTRRHLAQLAGIEDWQAKLHVLQYLDRLDLPEDAEPELLAFVEEALLSARTLVRAWGYSGLAVLARRFPHRRETTRQLLTSAKTSETAGSVKVRIRKALELLSA